MFESNSFNSFLDDLNRSNKKFIAVFDNFIKIAVDIIKKTEELQEELNGLECIYQILIPDVNFNFWLSISNRKMGYHKGKIEYATFYVAFTKDIVIKILRGEMMGVEAYMMGLIKTNGNLSYGIRFVKIFRLLVIYLKKFFLLIKNSSRI